MTKEEILAAFKECAAELGRNPSRAEMRRMKGVSKHAVKRHFGSFTRALRECGLERGGSGIPIDREFLFLEWMGMVRSLGKVPSITEYQERSKFSVRPLLGRCGAWSKVPERILEFAREAQLEAHWEDVLEIVRERLRATHGDDWMDGPGGPRISRPGVTSGLPVYGAPMYCPPMIYAPTNEMGVIVLFSARAREMGFAIAHIQIGFPDCEAMREVERDKWQRVRIEFEFESRNFQTHRHTARDADMIVCWTHNWPDCPLEVLELSALVERMG